MELELDVDLFKNCLSSRTFRNLVQKDVEHADELGLNATPVFFINGRYLSGAQPFEAFRAVIDEELELEH